MRVRVLRLGFLAVAVAVGMASAVLTGRVLDRPEGAPASVLTDPSAGLRVQQSVAELLLRQGGVSSRSGPVVVTAPELNAFLARHFESRRLGIRPLYVRAENGWLEVSGSTSLRRISAGADPGVLLRVLPNAILDLDLWLVVRGQLRARNGQGEFVVDRAAVGRQPVSPAWVWQFLGVSPQELLTWRLPRIVERIEVQPGRLVIHTRPRGG